MYMLAGLSHEERGWGLANETFGLVEAMRRYGEDAWFSIGDRDMATHLARTLGLARGETLTEITARLCSSLGVKARVVPMADAPVRTMLETTEHGTLPFQQWLVRKGGVAPTAVRFEGTHAAAPAALEVLARADLVVFGPS